MTLLPHKSLLLTQTRDPPTAQIITFDTNASPSYRTNHHLWRKNVTLLPHKSSLLTQKRDPPTAQITTFDTNTWSSYRTTHHFWHECVTLLPHKSSLFTQKRDPHTAQMSNFDTFYWCLRVVLQVIVVVWSYICRSYDEIHACAVRPDGFFFCGRMTLSWLHARGAVLSILMPLCSDYARSRGAVLLALCSRRCAVLCIQFHPA